MLFYGQFKINMAFRGLKLRSTERVAPQQLLSTHCDPQFQTKSIKKRNAHLFDFKHTELIFTGQIIRRVPAASLHSIRKLHLRDQLGL
jgi:hypothetical protein